jgi:hypothetical protein
MNVSIFMSIVAFSSILASVTTSTAAAPISNGHDQKELLALLRAQEFETLESATRQVQEKFEKGALSDIQLRNTYRQFYDLDEQDLAKIKEWKKTVPASYAAHLILGVYFKRKGFDARGDKYISQTPQENIDRMRQYHESAITELGKSLKLTEKPFLSVFHLLDLSKSGGSKEESRALVLAANKMLPSNTLARNRFMKTLTPRWGGSHEEMKQFIAQSKEEGVSTVGLIQLEAIMYDDMAATSLAQGDRQKATTYLFQAVALAQRVGGDSRTDWLPFADSPCAQRLEIQSYC